MKKKRFSLFLAAAFCSLLLTGCGSAGGSGGDYATMDAAMPMESYSNTAAMGGSYAQNAAEVAEEEGVAYDTEYDTGGATGKAGEIAEPAATDRKLIRNVNLTVETENFDGLMESIEAKIAELGGYVESMNVYNGSSYNRTGMGSYRNSSITARIPADRLDTFLDTMAENSNITYRSESVEDVTLQYVDVESHLEALRAQQERLMELIEMAETIEELVYLETELTDVRYQIQSLESQLRTMSNLVSYATVYIDVEEVTTYTPVVEKKTAWERMTEGFVHSCKELGENISEFFVAIVINLPYIIIWAVVIIVAVIVTRRIVRRNREKRKALWLAGQNRQQAASPYTVQNPEFSQQQPGERTEEQNGN